MKQTRTWPSLCGLWFGPALLFIATLALRSCPGNTTLTGYDEWILSTIASRIALWFIPQHDVYSVLVPTGYSYPPLGLWISGAFVYVLGPHPWVWRLPTALADSAAISMLFILGRRIGGSWTAWTAGLLAWSFLFLSFHDTVSLDFLLSFWILVSLYLFLRGVDEQRPALLMLSVFAGTLAIFTKYHGIVYLATLCVLVFVVPESRSLLRGKRLLGFVCSLLAVPCVMLALEGLTWHFYGFPKTHIAEVLRVMTWGSRVADPYTGAVVEPHWYYYLEYCWATLGWPVCVVCVCGVAYATLKQRSRAVWVLLAVIGVWVLWSATGNLKNARYFLPVVYLFFVFAGLLMERIAQTRAQWLPIVILVALCAWSITGTVHRIQHYHAIADRHAQVYQCVNTGTPGNAVILAESVPFQADDAVGISPIKRGVVGPDHAGWTRAEYLIADEAAWNLMRDGAAAVLPDYLAAREEIVRTWRPMLDVGTGDERLRVLERP